MTHPNDTQHKPECRWTWDGSTCVCITKNTAPDPNDARERALREWLGNKVTHGPRDYAFRAGWHAAWRACNEVAQLTIRELTEELESLERDLAAARAEAERLRKLFDDAGEGQYNVLNLVESYQRNSMEADERLRAVRKLLEENGCDCPCDHHPDERGPDCEVCLACRIAQEALSK